MWTYVPGHNTAVGAHCDRDVEAFRAATAAASAQNQQAGDASPWSYGRQPFGAAWTKTTQDAGPIISFSTSRNPQLAADIAIGRWLAAGSPLLPGAPGGPVLLPAAAAARPGPSQPQAHQRAASPEPRYQPPVQLVVLGSQLQRLGPSTPWRYTAGSLPEVGCQPRITISPLLQPPQRTAGARPAGGSPAAADPSTAAPWPAKGGDTLAAATADHSTGWFADACTQTVPAWLTADVSRLGECGPGEQQCQQQPLEAAAGGERGHLPGSSAAAASSGEQCSGRPCSRSPSSSPWRVIGRGPDCRRLPWGLEDDAAGVRRPWVPPGTAAAAAAGAPAVGARAGSSSAYDGTGSGKPVARPPSPRGRAALAAQQRARARQQLTVSAKYAAVCRAAAAQARELAATEAVAWQQQQQRLNNRPRSAAGRLQATPVAAIAAEDGFGRDTCCCCCCCCECGTRQQRLTRPGPRRQVAVIVTTAPVCKQQQLLQHPGGSAGTKSRPAPAPAVMPPRARRLRDILTQANRQRQEQSSAENAARHSLTSSSSSSGSGRDSLEAAASQAWHRVALAATGCRCGLCGAEAAGHCGSDYWQGTLAAAESGDELEQEPCHEWQLPNWEPPAAAAAAAAGSDCDRSSADAACSNPSGAAGLVPGVKTVSLSSQSSFDEADWALALDEQLRLAHAIAINGQAQDDELHSGDN